MLVAHPALAPCPSLPAIQVGVEFPLQHASHALVEVIEHATHGGAAGKVVICCHNNGD